MHAREEIMSSTNGAEKLDIQTKKRCLSLIDTKPSSRCIKGLSIKPETSRRKSRVSTTRHGHAEGLSEQDPCCSGNKANN